MQLRRPRLRIDPPYSRSETSKKKRELFQARIDYPTPHESPQIPQDFLPYATAYFTEILNYAKSLEREVRGSDWVYLNTTYEKPNTPEGREAHHGLAGPVQYMQRLMARLAADAPDLALDAFRRWDKTDEGIFARLRIWAAGQSFVGEAEACDVFVHLSDFAFWGSRHQSDLLYAVGARWEGFSLASRNKLETRLLAPSYPKSAWGGDRLEEYNAITAIERIRWLDVHGITFSFDVQAAIASFVTKTTRIPENVETAVDTQTSGIYSVELVKDPSPLEAIPTSDILTSLESLEGIDYRTHRRYDPFQGLVDADPRRALRALTLGRKRGDIPFPAWSTFLQSDKREKDSVEFIQLIVARLCQMSHAQLRPILFPVSDWTARLSQRLYREAPELFQAIWMHCVAAAEGLDASENERHPDEGWLAEAQHSPIGHLTEALFADPAFLGAKKNGGLSPELKARMQRLLDLPGDLHQHALVHATYLLTSFYQIDPKWVKAVLLPSQDDKGMEGEAFWDGFLWSNRIPQKPLFRLMKAALLGRTAQEGRRQSSTYALASMVLYIWGHWPATKAPYISNSEFRQVLLEAGSDFATRIIENLERSMSQQRIPGAKVVEFFAEVWPLQKMFRTPELSGRIASLIFRSNELFADLVAVTAKELVRTRHFDSYRAISRKDDSVIERYPAAVLTLMDTILPENPDDWPSYGIMDILDRLANADRTRSDPRLKRLSRASSHLASRRSAGSNP